MRMAWALALLAALIAGGAVGCSGDKAVRAEKIDEFLMPNLGGLYWVEAEPQLRELGWKGVLYKAGDVPGGPAQRNRIVSQDPMAGATVTNDAQITLRFGG
jgi:eukaryotic-like serine/threonine-protein kinase